MPEFTNPSAAHWSLGQAIPIELDIAMNAVHGSFMPQALPDEIDAFVRAVPADWITELEEMFGKSPKAFNVLEPAAYLAGVEYDRDYSHATLAIREATLETAVKRLSSQTAEKVKNESGITDFERYMRLTIQVYAESLRGFGLDSVVMDGLLGRIETNGRNAARILHDGDLSSRFWHWMDRFYYEVYHPWRSGREAFMHTVEQQAAAALGGYSGSGTPPLNWLPLQNPLVMRNEIQPALQAGALNLYFWVEPFGLADTWTMFPDSLLVSIAEPGKLFENFHLFANDLANRASALGDPTRLIILRMIRQFGMNNTEIASFLGISRPTVSIHAKILREAGLIGSTQEGREMRHTIDPTELRRLFADLESFLDLPEASGLGNKPK